eukprot:238861_1
MQYNKMNQFICITIIIYVIINTKTINSIVHIYLISLNTVSQSNFATYSDIQSKCIGIILSYDKYSGVINDLYLGIGQHVLVSEIEDRISGAKASYIIQPNITVVAASNPHHSVIDIGYVNRWFNTYNSQKVFAFIIALSHSLSIDSFSTTYFDYQQVNNWDTSITKNSNNLKTLTQSFYDELKTKNMITPKVTMQYFDTLYCIIIMNLKPETDDTLSDIIAWSNVIDDIYRFY